MMKEMNNEGRRSENIVKALEETGVLMKDAYCKKDVEDELLKFQKLLVSKVFEEQHARNLRLDDVQQHLNDLAQEKGIAGIETLTIFNKQTDNLKILIRKEINGNKGEKLMANNLKNMHVANRVVANVELSDGEMTTEIDDIVITTKGIFIIETKYSATDVHITEGGIYKEIATGNVLSNLGEKMNYKESLVRACLMESGFEKKVVVKNIVAFSNGKSNFTNEYEYFRAGTCGVVPHWIDEDNSETIYTVEEMDRIAEILEQASNRTEYPIHFNFGEYRKIFADILSATEAGVELDEEDLKDTEPVVQDIGETQDGADHRKVNWKRVAKYSAVAAGCGLLIAGKTVTIGWGLLTVGKATVAKDGFRN